MKQVWHAKLTFNREIDKGLYLLKTEMSLLLMEISLFKTYICIPTGNRDIYFRNRDISF